MAKTPKYPNPKFFKAKDNIDWKKQWENLKVCGGIFYEMFKETDWEAFKNGWKNTLKNDAARIKEEYNAFMALDQQGKLDAILYGEKRLGRLYAKGAMATVRREWRGVAGYDEEILAAVEIGAVFYAACRAERGLLDPVFKAHAELFSAAEVVFYVVRAVF